MKLGNISASAENTASQKQVVGDLNPARSLPKALATIGSLMVQASSTALRHGNVSPPGFAPTTSKNRKSPITSLPPGVLEIIARFLPLRDLANLARTCNTLREELKEPLQKRKAFILKSQTLTCIPRENRLEALKDILANMYPHDDVLNNVIAACGHIPSQQRLQARRAIEEWAALLPQSQTEGLPDVSTRLDEVTQNLESVDAFHTGIAQIMDLAPGDQALEFLQKCDDIAELPEGHRLDAYHAIFDRPRNSQDLLMLRKTIPHLPESNMGAEWHAQLNTTQDPQVPQDLTELFVFFPKEDRIAKWDAIFIKTQDPQVLQKLASAIFCLPSEHRSTKWYAIFNKTQDPQVLQQLAEEIQCLPTADRIAATLAINVARNQSA